MNRREFLCLAVGLTSGLMIESPQSVVKIPNRPRIGPLPPPTPPPMPIQMAGVTQEFASVQMKVNGSWIDLGKHAIENIQIGDILTGSVDGEHTEG